MSSNQEFLPQRRKERYLEPGRLCAFAPLREKQFLNP